MMIITLSLQKLEKIVIDNNVNRNRFVYNSRVNPTCSKALVARQSPRGWAVKYKTDVIHSHVFVASDIAVHVSSSSKGCVKPNVTPVSGTNASRSYVKQVTGSAANVKQMTSTSQVNVNPNCENTDMLQGSGDIVSLTDQIVTMVNSSDQVQVSQAPDVSDLTAEVISAPGVKGKTDQVYNDQNMAAKVISAPEAQGKSLAGNVTDCKVENDEQGTEMIQCGPLPLYDANFTGVEDKFDNSILHVHQFSTSGDNGKVDSKIQCMASSVRFLLWFCDIE